MDSCYAFVGCSAVELYGPPNAGYYEAIYDDDFRRAGKCCKLWQADGDFSLEVSSPGLDEPLKLNRQYKKNIGRFVEVLLNDTTKKEGKLLEATEDGIIIEYELGKGKKKEIKQETILFTDIKHTKIQIKF